MLAIGQVTTYFYSYIHCVFHLVNTIGNIFTRGCATRENITDGVRSMK